MTHKRTHSLFLIGTVLLALVLMVALTPAALAATPVTVTVVDHAGVPIQGAKAQYSYGGIYTCGYTDINGQAVCNVPNLSATLRVEYNRTVATKPTSDPNFQTAQAVIKLIDHAGSPLDGGKVVQNKGALYNIGNTGDSAPGALNYEVFPGDHTFRIDYNHTNEQKTATISGPTTDVVFQTGQIVIHFSESVDHQQQGGGSLYAFNGTGEFLPAPQVFGFGKYLYPNKYLTITPIAGQTVEKTVAYLRLKDHAGNPLAGGTARGGYANPGTWFVSGATDSDGALLDIRDGNQTQLSYEMKYNKVVAIDGPQDPNVNAFFDFQTILLTMRLETCAGDPLDGGRVRGGVGSTFTTWWFPDNTNQLTGSSAPGEVAAEFFPGTYSFEMQYAATKQAKQDVVIPNANTTLIWKTTPFFVSWGGPVSYGGGQGDSTWFTKPTTELLPGPVMFHFRDYVNAKGNFVEGYRQELVVGSCDEMKFQILNGSNRPDRNRYTKFVGYQGQKEIMSTSCPLTFADEYNMTPDGLLLDMSADDGDVCHFGGRQRIGVKTTGEGGGNTDTVGPGETLILKVGTDPSVAGRNWDTILLHVDGNNATMRATYFENGSEVGSQTTHAVSGVQYVSLDPGVAFDEVRLTADAGRFGLKGFRYAAQFSFAE